MFDYTECKKDGKKKHPKKHHPKKHNPKNKPHGLAGNPKINSNPQSKPKPKPTN